MRNLKRALSLALASVMLMGMMVVGSSAASFPDVDDNDNIEAIDVLETVQVMIGNEKGDFEPDKPVTRAEMAVVMAKLLNYDYDYYVTTCPFNDVPDWAKGYVGACAANGIVSGRGEGVYDPDATVTAVEAASMMMRALGYFKHSGDYTPNFETATVAQASRISLFSGIGGNANDPLNRNQVAKLALNTLEAKMVDFTGDMGLEIPNVGNVGYKSEYTERTGTEAKYGAIHLDGERTTLGGVDSRYYVQLGEQLYEGDLKMTLDVDDFGRPARTWEYDGKTIGTYVRDNLLRKEYTDEVTGRDLYDLLGASVVSTNPDKWAVYVAIDGEDDVRVNELVFDKTDLTRSNTDGIGGTGKGVLTQVYVDTLNSVVYIAVINTYLAIATEDYNDKDGEVELEVYALNESSISTSKNPDYIKDTDNEKTAVTVEDEDIDVSSVEEDEMFLVTVAQGKVQSMTVPEVLSDSAISSFKKTKDVVVDGTTYAYADTAKYDVEVLDHYEQSNLKDNTYNVICDLYDNLIGIEKNENTNQYLFLSGLDGSYSYLAAKNADANVIFTDGTMATVTVSVSKSEPLVNGQYVKGGDWTDPAGNGHGMGNTSDDRNFSQLNTWCTYTVSSDGVYTLKEVDADFPERGNKVAQSAMDANSGADGDANNEIQIDSKNVTLNNAAGTGKVYGNDDTVYLNVELESINTKEATDPWYQVVDNVQNVIVGAKNANLTIKDLGSSGDGSAKNKGFEPENEVYALYNDKGYVIAAVVIGEDDGTNSTFAYIFSDEINRESYDGKNVTWTREAIVNGDIVELKVVDDDYDLLDDMGENEWYEIKMNDDGYVTKTTLINAVDTEGPGGTHTAANNTAANAEDYVFCANTNHFDTANPVTRDYPKFIGDVEMVYEANKDNDTVILFQHFDGVEGTDTFTFNGRGTMYVDGTAIKGFDVSPDVKVAVCLSDGAGDPFDETTSGYTGYNGLKNVLANRLDSNFTGDLSVVFNKGTAVVIIFNDTTVADSEPVPYTLNYASVANISDLAVTNNSNGRAIAAGSDVVAGTTVKVAATVASGFTATVKVNDVKKGTISGTGNVTFNMPAQNSTITFVVEDDSLVPQSELSYVLDSDSTKGGTNNSTDAKVVLVFHTDGNEPSERQIVNDIAAKLGITDSSKITYTAGTSAVFEASKPGDLIPTYYKWTKTGGVIESWVGDIDGKKVFVAQGSALSALNGTATVSDKALTLAGTHVYDKTEAVTTGGALTGTVDADNPHYWPVAATVTEDGFDLTSGFIKVTTVPASTGSGAGSFDLTATLNNTTTEVAAKAMVKTTDTFKIVLKAKAPIDGSTWTGSGLSVAGGSGATVTYSGSADDVASNTGGTLTLKTEKSVAKDAIFTVVVPAAAAASVTVTDGTV